MENQNNTSENIENKEPQLPIGILFDSINYYHLDDLNKFVDGINHEQAIYCIIQAAQAAYKRNAFNIIESEVLSKSIRTLSSSKK